MKHPKRYKSVLHMVCDLSNSPELVAECQRRIKEKNRTINLNTLAKQITEREGLKVSLSVAQCKECLRHTLDLLAEESDATVLKLLARRRNRGER